MENEGSGMQTIDVRSSFVLAKCVIKFLMKLLRENRKSDPGDQKKVQR